MNPQRGKPILPNAQDVLYALGPFWEHRHAPRPPVRPLGLRPVGSRLCFYFPFTVGQKAAAVAPKCPGVATGQADGGRGFQARKKTRSLKALVFVIFPRPPGAIRHLPQSRLRFGSLRRICGPIRPKGLPCYERKTDGVVLPSGLQYVPIWL